MVAFCARCAAEKRYRQHRLGRFDGTIWHPSPDRRIDRRYRHTVALMNTRRRPGIGLGVWQDLVLEHTPVTLQHAEWMGWVHGRCPEHGSVLIDPADLVRAYRTGQRKIL
jgi:hypothetical protein